MEFFSLLISNFFFFNFSFKFPGSSDGKESACNAGDLGSFSGSGRSPGEGNGNPLQYSCLENSMDIPHSCRVGHNWATNTTLDLQYCVSFRCIAYWFRYCYSVANFCPIFSDPMDCARLPCPSLSPRVCSNLYALTWWCHAIISPSVSSFSSCPQSFPGSESFPMIQLFESGGQYFTVSASVLSMNIQGWCPLGLTGLISLLPKGLSKIFFSTTVQKHQF